MKKLKLLQISFFVLLFGLAAVVSSPIQARIVHAVAGIDPSDTGALVIFSGDGCEQGEDEDPPPDDKE